MTARTHQRYFEAVLGTTLELQLRSAQAQVAENAALEEIQRLEQIFSHFLPNSELNRFLATQALAVAISSDLEWVLRAGLEWQERSGGAFHLATQALVQFWQHAQTMPNPSELAPILNAMGQPLLELSVGQAVRHSSLPINLNAIAKGYIADRAANRALEHASEVLVNLGGDLVHRGHKPVVVSLANPCSSADNAPPLERIQICNQGLATSGHTWRAMWVGQTRVSHLLDPRTGQPVQDVLSASVLAPDAMTADVLATVCSVLPPEQSFELLRSEPQIGVCIVSKNRVHHNDFWKQHQI